MESVVMGNPTLGHDSRSPTLDYLLNYCPGDHPFFKARLSAEHWVVAQSCPCFERQTLPIELTTTFSSPLIDANCANANCSGRFRNSQILHVHCPPCGRPAHRCQRAVKCRHRRTTRVIKPASSAG